MSEPDWSSGVQSGVRGGSATRTPAGAEACEGDQTFRVRVGSHWLRYSDQAPKGREHERPLLLINGLGGNIEMWAPLRRALGARRTIAFDAPGTGESSTPFRPLTMRELGRVTRSLLDALDVVDADVLGYSFGGAIAQELARAAGPSRVHRMVLAATTCGWGVWPGDAAALLALVTPARYYFAPATVASTAMFGDGALVDFAAADAARLARPPDPVGYWWQILAALGWSSLHWLRRIQVPTLVLAAERDRMVRAGTARLLARRIPNARLEVIPRASHFFLLRERNVRAAGAITAFLDEDVAAAAPDVRAASA
jgi:pimeloyl-ACP methyl ester carboxylesterase